MKKYINMKAVFSSLAAVAAVMFFVACSDWTDVDSLDTDEIIAREQNEQQYQQYLSNLRQWRKSDHKIVIGWFDNSVKIPSSRAHHITDVPDSVDIIALMYPDNLADFEIEDIATVRRDKGMKVIYTVDYDAIKNEIDLEILNAERNGDEVPDFETTFRERFGAQLEYFTKYGYDGISIGYCSVKDDFLTKEEYEEVQKYQDIVFGAYASLMEQYPDKIYLFEGLPENVADKSILSDYDYIVLKTQDAQTINEVALLAQFSMIEGVPTGNIIIPTYARSTASDDTQTGIFWIRDPETGTSSDYSAMVVIADWILEPDNIGKRGLGVYRINDDYYFSDLAYKNVREAINIMNPSPKN
ncbi:MAG: glycoside hydrolase family 18 [Rikenellaceae bacterium]|nr:glycoside hydrolase family 18 [Rikenellaceae bacterium]